MLSYNEIEDTNIAEITLRGPVSREAYLDLLLRFETLKQRHGSIRVLETTDRSLLSLASTFWRDIDFCRRFLPFISHAAVVGDPMWVRVWVNIAAPYMTTRVRFFPTADATLAKDWLLGASQKPANRLHCQSMQPGESQKILS